MMQTMSLGMIKQNKRVEFVRMRGPKSKGHAEIAVSRVPGSGPETPNKENFKLEDFNDEQVFMKVMLFINLLGVLNGEYRPKLVFNCNIRPSKINSLDLRPACI